jgi:hypothetical protein
VSATAVPRRSFRPTEEQVAFCARVVERSGVAERLEAMCRRRTGRPRRLPLRALFVGLLLLAADDRPLHLKALTRLLHCELPAPWQERLGVSGEATTRRAFLARYRCVRYAFHLAVSLLDPSCEAKNKVLAEDELARRRRRLSVAEVAERAALLQGVLDDLLDASVGLLSEEELAAFDGSVGLDATPVPLYSRGPSQRAGTCASDPDGGWYVREGDHREATGPSGKPLRKLHWALEATLVQMGRPPGSLPAHPNLVVGLRLRRPGEDPAGTAVGLLASLARRGYPARFLAVDRGYSQARAEDFHLPVAALGYQVVMDYKTAALGRQGESRGALLVDGAFYCPALPAALVAASADRRAGRIDDDRYRELLEARRPFRLQRKEGPDRDGFARYGCPAAGERPQLCCPLRPEAASRSLGRIPVLAPPADPPAVCVQGSVTIAPDVGARHRQALAYGSETWRSTYAAYRNTTEGANGFLKDAAHESLASPGRRRVRGLAAQSVLCCFLVMAGNIRKIAAFRELQSEGLAEKAAERARRRRVRLSDFRPRT